MNPETLTKQWNLGFARIEMKASASAMMVRITSMSGKTN